MDARSAEKYESDINNIRTNQKLILELAKNHTSITDATLRLFKENTEFIDQELQNLNETISREIAKNSYIKIVLKLILTMIKVQHLQDKMLEIILDTHHGTFNPILLPPSSLSTELKLIKDRIADILIIPDIIDGDLAKIYNLMTVKTRLTNNNILFSIKIPLPDMELYEVFKIVPLPITYKTWHY